MDGPVDPPVKPAEGQVEGKGRVRTANSALGTSKWEFCLVPAPMGLVPAIHNVGRGGGKVAWVLGAGGRRSGFVLRMNRDSPARDPSIKSPDGNVKEEGWELYVSMLSTPRD